VTSRSTIERLLCCVVRRSKSRSGSQQDATCGGAIATETGQGFHCHDGERELPLPALLAADARIADLRSSRHGSGRHRCQPRNEACSQ